MGEAFNWSDVSEIETTVSAGVFSDPADASMLGARREQIADKETRP
jgi:hypothetical protein